MTNWDVSQGYGRGMTIVFMPGLSDTGHDIVASDLQRKAALAGALPSVHISDDAYSIVEICIRKHWPGYNSGLRYGLFTITAEQWRLISIDMLRLGRRFRMRSIQQIGLPLLRSRGWQDRRRLRRFIDERIEIADMLGELQQTLDVWIVRWPVINVHGY